MTEEKKKTTTKTAAKKAPAKPASTAKKAASGNTVTVTQTGSTINRQKYQEANLRGLGLGRIGRTKTLEDTPSVRGMIRAVSHLVKVEEAA